MKILLWVHSKNLDNLRLRDRHLRRLAGALPRDRIVHCTSREQFLAGLPEAEVAVTWLFKQEWLALAPRLRRIISPSAGREHHPAEVPAGVSLEFSGFHGRIMAETVLAMMLCHARGLMRAARLQHAGPSWPQRDLEPHLRILRDSHVVILGFGHIGEHVGRLAKGCGARLTGLRRTPGAPPRYFTPHDRLGSAGELEAVLPQADHLALCLPGGPETDRVLDGVRLRLLPDHAGIYNVGRGNAIDEAALAEVLRDRPGTEAYLDVFNEEPLPEDSPLRPLPNCLVLPHLSPNAPEFMDLFVEELLGRLQPAAT